MLNLWIASAHRVDTETILMADYKTVVCLVEADRAACLTSLNAVLVSLATEYGCRSLGGFRIHLLTLSWLTWLTWHRLSRVLT